MSPILPPLYKIIIINRECDTDRLSHMIDICKKLGKEPIIFKAVCADEITIMNSGLNNIKFVKFDDELYLHDITKSDFPITSGMMAACISYREVYNKLLNDEESQGYIILEDDIILNENKKADVVQTQHPNNDEINTSLDKYIEGLPNWCHFDIAFLDNPRYLYAGNINNNTSMYICYSHINFGRNYTQLITKRGVTKLLSHFGKWIYKSPEDTLNIACSKLFSDVIVPVNPIFLYTDNWTSTKFPLSRNGECIEWHTQNYNDPQKLLQSYSRNCNDLGDRFYEFKNENNNSLEFEAFWINVGKQTNRAEFMINELNMCGIPHTRIDAFTPSTLPNIEDNQNCYVSNLEYACMCSHIKAYEIALKSKVDWFLILEDDMIMYESQKEKVNVYIELQNILASRPKDAECLQLFCSNPDIQRLLVTYSIKGEEWVKIDNSHIGYESKFGGSVGGWKGSQFWGACAYFISRKAVTRNLKRYTNSNNSCINFKSLTHPINPESVVYSHLKCYSHTNSIFTTREDIRSIVHVQSNEWVGHTQQQYCNFVVRERLNYKLNTCDNFSQKTFIFIIGANSHTSGAYELARILNRDPYQHIEIECDGVLCFPRFATDKLDDINLISKLNKISMRDYPRVGDIGHYYLSYVKMICDKIPHVKFIYLDCHTNMSVNHFMQTTPMQNYWIDNLVNNGDTNVINSDYDKSYPSDLYKDSDKGYRTKEDLIVQYCEDHRNVAKCLQESYPSQFKIFTDITNRETLKQIYEFLGSPMKNSQH